MSLLRIDYGFLMGIASACVVMIVLLRLVEARARKLTVEKTRRILQQSAVLNKEE
jgi:hypothetical protein